MIYTVWTIIVYSGMSLAVIYSIASMYVIL